MKKIACQLMIAIFIISCNSATPAKDEKTETPAQSPAYASVLDSSRAKILETAIIDFAKGDVNGFTSMMTDNVVFYYPAPGDSLVGSSAVNTYYTGRWKLIDSIKLIKPTYLPVQVNISTSVMQGEWLMAWFAYQIHYKSGNAIFLPIHAVAHINSTGKADVFAMYYDMQKPVMAQRK